MEVFDTRSHYVLKNGTICIYFDKATGGIEIKDSSLMNDWKPVCLGKAIGLFGKLRYIHESEWKLILIKQAQHMGFLPDGTEVRRVSEVVILPLSNRQEPVNLLECEHHPATYDTSATTQPPLLRSVQSKLKLKKNPSRGHEKYERNINEALLRMLHNVEDEAHFYYADRGADVTYTLQAKQAADFAYGFPTSVPLSWHQPSWRKARAQFFWNQHCLADVLSVADRFLEKEGLPAFGQPLPERKRAPLVAEPGWRAGIDLTQLDRYVCDLEAILFPVMQGFFQRDQFVWVQDHSQSLPRVEALEAGSVPTDDNTFATHMNVCLLSRRSKYRAGIRLRRRGIDDDGHVANFVETEQMLQIHRDTTPHTVAFVQLRGSVPVYWSQPGVKYRPPVVLEGSDEANRKAYEKHMQNLISNYTAVTLVNLMDTGRERKEWQLGQAFERHVLLHNHPDVTYVCFDFHAYCSNLRFENASLLFDSLADRVREMKYFWMGNGDVICQQRGVFRVNCVDCIDRTNVVQCMFAIKLVEVQLQKLGLLPPEVAMPANFVRKLQNAWANNGDAISWQYAGTIAMKGDYTRTGERTVNGLVRDGVSSVNRYYLRFRDMSRQAAIDLLLGNEMPELQLLRSGTENELAIMRTKESNIKLLVQRCRELLIAANEKCLCEALLISTDEPLRETREVNTVVLVTDCHIHIIRLDKLNDQTCYVRLPLESVDSLEFGLVSSLLFNSGDFALRINYHGSDVRLVHPTARQQDSLMNMLPFNKATAPRSHSISLRQPNLRLFNNMLASVGRGAEASEALKVVASIVQMAGASKDIEIDLVERAKLDRVKQSAPPAEYCIPLDVEQLYEGLAISPLPRQRAPMGLARSSSAGIMPSGGQTNWLPQVSNDVKRRMMAFRGFEANNLFRKMRSSRLFARPGRASQIPAEEGEGELEEEEDDDEEEELEEDEVDDESLLRNSSFWLDDEEEECEMTEEKGAKTRNALLASSKNNLQGYKLDPGASASIDQLIQGLGFHRSSHSAWKRSPDGEVTSEAAGILFDEKGGDMTPGALHQRRNTIVCSSLSATLSQEAINRTSERQRLLSLAPAIDNLQIVSPAVQAQGSQKMIAFLQARQFDNRDHLRALYASLDLPGPAKSKFIIF